MSFHKTESTDCVVLESSKQVTASVIWLHGLGADGYDFVPIVPELRLPAELGIRFVFPHARLRPVTINNGYVMRAWYDIKALALNGPEDEIGIRESESSLREYIQRERDAGVAADRTIVAGFSQGGAIALHTALRYPQRLAGVMALSTYLPLRQTLSVEASAANRDAPIFMCHGSQDFVVPMTLGEMSRDVLSKLGYNVMWKQYPMAHEVCAQEIVDIANWLRARLIA
ncbi:MAG TPA: alpha/beta hydrolase-fold protein [Steroidobacteraceae bacterium]|nr:alpha/beta hydrolase-fold protein [Steroidobacteraceae bacterium]